MGDEELVLDIDDEGRIAGVEGVDYTTRSLTSVLANSHIDALRSEILRLDERGDDLDASFVLACSRFDQPANLMEATAVAIFRAHTRSAGIKFDREVSRECWTN